LRGSRTPPSSTPTKSSSRTRPSENVRRSRRSPRTSTPVIRDGRVT
jgi:hypothetical protein